MDGESGHDEFEALYRAYYTRVHRLARRRVGADAAEDVTQEVMIRALRHLPTLDPDRPVWPWLATVTERVAIDHLRRRRDDDPVTGLELLADPAGDVVAQVIRSDARVRLSRSLAMMTGLDRMLLVRHVAEGVTVAAIARTMDASPNALRQRVFRATRLLARNYRQLGGQYGWVLPAAAAPRLLGSLARAARRIGRPAVAARVAVTATVATTLLVHPNGVVPELAGPSRAPAAVTPAVPRDAGPVTAGTAAVTSLAGRFADAGHWPASLLRHGPAATQVRHLAFGFDGTPNGWRYMPEAGPACDGESRSGRCAIAIDPVCCATYALASYACAAYDSPQSLGIATRIAFWFRVSGDGAALVEVTFGSGYLWLTLGAGGSTLLSERGVRRLDAPLWDGEWHRAVLDLDLARATATAGIDGATATLPFDPAAGTLEGIRLAGVRWPTVGAPAGSTLRFDSMTIDVTQPADLAERPGIGRPNSSAGTCPVAAAGRRVAPVSADHRF
jgi:RNA polymerase sigma-70 factor (ECF subfamily)